MKGLKQQRGESALDYRRRLEGIMRGTQLATRLRDTDADYRAYIDEFMDYAINKGYWRGFLWGSAVSLAASLIIQAVFL